MRGRYPWRLLQNLRLVGELLHEGRDVGDDLAGGARRRQRDRLLLDHRGAGAVVGELGLRHRLLLRRHDALERRQPRALARVVVRLRRDAVLDRARRDDAQVDRDHAVQRDLLVLDAAVDLAPDGEARLVGRELDRRRERRLRPAQLGGEHLADLVGVAVAAHHVDRAIGAHREAGPDLLGRVVGAERHHEDLAAGEPRVVGAVLEQPERGLDRVLVERVDDPGCAGQVDVAILDLGLLRRVGDPLHGNQNLHEYVSFLRGLGGWPGCSRPPVTSATTQSAARTISNFFGRVPGAGPALPADAARSGCLASTHASASSSRIPKIMRAAMWLGTAPSSSPGAGPWPMTRRSMRRKSANCGLSYSFMNLLDWRSSIVSTSATELRQSSKFM